MAQIGINTLHGEGVIFVVNIEDMLPRKDGEPRKICVKENKRSACSIILRLRQPELGIQQWLLSAHCHNQAQPFRVLEGVFPVSVNHMEGYFPA